MSIKKFLLSVILSVAVVAGLSGAAFADGWKVSFDGKSMSSNYSSGQVHDAISGLQPGSKVSFTVAMDSAYAGQAQWYLKNEVLTSLEQSVGNASDGAYGYNLSYTAPDGSTKVLFDSITVGGDGSVLGLAEATEATSEWFFLDEMSQGQSGFVTMTVALDGETQGNSYEQAAATLELSFAAEAADKTGSDQKVTSTAKTGDNLPLLVMGAVVIAAGLVALWAAVMALKRDRKKGEK